MTPSVITAYAHWAEWALFVWVLANQGGVPIPVAPALLGAGALAGSGSLSVVVTLAVSVAAALCADLTWYLLGWWRGSRALDLLTRLVPKARTHVQCASHLLFAHERAFRLGARFFPVVNPIAAGLAGAAGMSVSRFLPGAAVSAAVWAGSWIGIGYLLTHGGAGLARSFGIPLTFVVIAILVGWLLLRQAQRRLLLHTLGRARVGRDTGITAPGAGLDGATPVEIPVGLGDHGARTSSGAGIDSARYPYRAATETSAIRPVRRLLVTTSLISALLAPGCKGETTASQPKGQAAPPPAVLVAEVIRKNVPVYGEYVAQTVANAVVDIPARVEATLEKVLFVEGASVKKDQILFELDKRTYAAQVQAARAALSPEKVVVTEMPAQAVISNRKASDLFACKWLRARDSNRRCRAIWAVPVQGD